MARLRRRLAALVGLAAEHRVPALPADPLDLARHLVAHADALTVGTLMRRLPAVCKAHVVAGQPNPADDFVVREVLRRQHGTARSGARRCGPPTSSGSSPAPAVPSPAGPGLGLAEPRDRALLLAFTTALLRSELVALDLADL